MSDLVLDPNTGDLDLISGALSLTADEDVIRQRLAMRLRMVRGEYFVDDTIGTDYYGQILGRKDPSFASTNAELVRVITTTEGVNELLEAIEYNLVGRVLEISFKVDTVAGVIEVEETLPLAA